MRIPAYLTVSRHHLYYLRYPISPKLHPRGISSSVKLSLGTRDLREALDLARRLSYVAKLLCEYGAYTGMVYAEIRAMLDDYFSSALAEKKRAMAQEGPLTPLQVYCLRSEVAEAHVPTTDNMKEHVAKFQIDSMLVDWILEKHGKPTSLSIADRQALINEYRKANGAYAQAVLDYDASANDYVFDPLKAEQSTQVPAPSKASGTTLGELVVSFMKFADIEGRWIGKTKGEKEEHINLLFEAIGADIDASRVDAHTARDIRDMLVAYPVNRSKMPATRGKSLAEIRAGKWPRTLHLRTISKYLQTYNSLFGWAKRNGYMDQNPFEGLNLDTSKANKEPPRRPFSENALETICKALLAPTVLPHHKWGSLVALHTGARLNEVAQLDPTDIVQRDGIWCIDINSNGPNKKLKNAQSARVVPIHPRLLDLGLLSYVDTIGKLPPNTKLFPQFTHSVSDGYGRNLGRWFNETLLPDLGLKSKQHTFHSLRHSMVARLIAAKVDQPHIMAIVGHEPGTTTLKFYNAEGFPPKQLLDALRKIFQPMLPPSA